MLGSMREVTLTRVDSKIGNIVVGRLDIHFYLKDDSSFKPVSKSLVSGVKNGRGTQLTALRPSEACVRISEPTP